MLSFKQYLTERWKSRHEDRVRQIASKARAEWINGTSHPHDDTERRTNSMTVYGDCDHVAAHVAQALKPHYPSAKVVGGNYHGKTTSGMHDDIGMSGHAWVEIPEIKHYVDPSHDQFHGYLRSRMPMVKDRFPGNAIRIGHTKHYKKHGYYPNTKPGTPKHELEDDY